MSFIIYRVVCAILACVCWGAYILCNAEDKDLGALISAALSLVFVVLFCYPQLFFRFTSFLWR